MVDSTYRVVVVYFVWLVGWLFSQLVSWDMFRKGCFVLEAVFISMYSCFSLVGRVWCTHSILGVV